MLQRTGLGSKEDAEQVKWDVKAFLQNALKLEMSDTKTKVTHTGDRAKFLGYLYLHANVLYMLYFITLPNLPILKASLAIE